MNSSLKQALKALSYVGLEINFAFDRGLSIAGMNIGPARHKLALRSSVALEACLKRSPATVLDVGSGGGQHADAFARAGARVTCVDFGTSVYALDAKTTAEGVSVIRTDFLKCQLNDRYELVWASHVLEHQRNVGLFLEKLIDCCAPEGLVAITVPFPHRHLWGGHLSLWTPGLLAYNVVMCGVDLSCAELLYGYRETTLIFSPKRVQLPELTFDSGDLAKLKPFLPKPFGENSNAWF